MGFRTQKAMSGSRIGPMPADLFGLLALLAVLTLAACEDEARPVPASTPTPEAEAVSTAAPTQTRTPEPTATPTSEPTAAPTATRAPEPTSTPMPARTVTAADVEAVFASDDGTWRELFDILGADEQACIREGVGEELDETLDAKLNKATEGHVVILRCLPPDLADSVLIVALVSDLNLDEFGIDRQVTTEERRCLEDFIEGQDAATLMETLATDLSSAEAAAFVGRVFKCIPDMLIAVVIWNTRVPVAVETEDLDTAALECMREAVQGISDRLAGAIAGQEEELAEEGFAFLATMHACAPDILGPGLTGTPAVTDEEYLAERIRAFVKDALNRYLSTGREHTLVHYSSPEHVEGQWYVFIIGEDGRIAAHYIPELIGADANELVDSEGYAYGPELLKASETGRWVSYVYLNPETGEEQRKHSWVVRLDGLIFGSGWYE